MSSRATRPLLSLTLTITFLGLFALLLTILAIERADPEDLARAFPPSPPETRSTPPRQ